MITSMQAVVLAGGLGTRLRPLTETLPKAMINIHGRPFIQYQLELLLANGVRNIVLCVGHRSEKIKEYLGDGSSFGVNVSYSDDGENLLGTAGALRNAEDLLEDEFFVMNGDSYVPIEFTEPLCVFRETKKLGLMVVYRNADNYCPSNVVLNGQLVHTYNRERKWPDMVYIDYGLNIFRKDVLGFIPTAKYFLLDDIQKELISKKELAAFVARKRFYEVGSLQGISDFEQYLRRTDKLT